jgi:hypothetical protein
MRWWSRPKDGMTKVSSDELDEFERLHGIKLPSDYRAFAKKHGEGGTGWETLSLEEWCTPCDPETMPPGFLSNPFPHSHRWCECTAEELKKGYRYFDKVHWTGSMRVANLGCENYCILIVSGAEYGSIWVDERMSGRGIYPLSVLGKPRVTFREFAQGAFRAYLEGLGLY